MIATNIELRETAEHVDVTTWSDDAKHIIHRFPNDREGHGRAVQYRNAFNASLRKAMGVTDADLELERADFNQRPGEYERALLAEMYREHTAALTYVAPVPVVGNADPLPTDYPHDF